MEILSCFRERKFQRKFRWACFLCFCAIWSVLTIKTGCLVYATGIILAGIIFLEAFKGKRIPVLTFHSVSENDQWLKEPSIVISVESFKRQMEWLKTRKYTTLSMEQLYKIRKEKLKIKKKLIVLTFDDGYLDAWTAVGPILKKYGLQGTVFVTGGYIDPGILPRPSIETGGKLQWKGYLNKKEIALLAEERSLAIESHGMSHDRIFTSDNLIGFVTPDNYPVWLYLLINPEERTTWFKKKWQVQCVYPLFATGEALAVPAFFPNPELIEKLSRLTDSAALNKAVEQFTARGGLKGTFETKNETIERWKNELSDSKKMLEKIIEKPVNHLCWPRSAWNPETEKLAAESGYLSTTSGNDHNDYSEPCRVSRVHIGGIGNPFCDHIRFVLEIWVFQGHYIFFPLLWVIQKIMFFSQRRRKKI